MGNRSPPTTGNLYNDSDIYTSLSMQQVMGYSQYLKSQFCNNQYNQHRLTISEAEYR
jgi:hypothetical protein